MIREFIIRILLSPLTLLYGMAITCRNLLYKYQILRPVRFDIPIISIGNLSIGGTGKSPHIEYLVNWLKDYLPVAILSRGYKRESTGFQIGQHTPSVKAIGDEPFQFLMKFPEIPVAVAEQRETGIPLLLKSFPGVKLILLDDAFQHLSVKPYINILLTSYELPFTRDYLLPSGRLREWRSSYRRADIIIVTKCPPDMVEQEGIKLKKELRLLPHQSLFFTEYTYNRPYFIFDRSIQFPWRPEFFGLLVSGIANTEYLQTYLRKQINFLQLFSFADHHWYSNYDLGQIKRQYDQLPGPNKIILTTEKDATRLALHRDYILENKLPIFVLPVEVSFLWNEENQFKDILAQKLLEFKS
ncbi:MAG: tetraacyldisaccharide 4'-kinase [Saprospiraceae bacterium]|nr:tetraacyldisaccharide 4'-kinase [Saprospiraceae bacterium]